MGDRRHTLSQRTNACSEGGGEEVGRAGDGRGAGGGQRETGVGGEEGIQEGERTVEGEREEGKWGRRRGETAACQIFPFMP